MEFSERISQEYLWVNSCGRQFLTERTHTMYRKNGRVDYHILYLERGSCYVEEAGKTILAQEGSVILFRPKEPHFYRFLTDTAPVNCYIHFSGFGCEDLLEKFSFSEKRVYPVGVSHRLSSVFSRMLEAYHGKQAYSGYSAAACLLEFLTVAAQQLCEQREREKGNYDPLIEEIRGQMQLQYREHRSVPEYAQMCHLSGSRFSHRFREATGESPNSYVNRLRVERAKQILCDTDCSMSEVATLVGFSDQNYFGRIFKKYTGQSPLQYAKSTEHP